MDPKETPLFPNKRNGPPNLPANIHPVANMLVPRNHYVMNPSYNAAPPPTPEEDDDSDGGIMEYWRVLMRHKRAIILSSLAGLALGFAVGIPMKPKFRATTTLEVLTLNGDFMNQKSSNPTTTNDNNYDTSEEQTQAKLLQGSALIGRVFAKLNPGGSVTKTIPPLATSGWRSWLHLREKIDQTPKEKLLARAADSLKVHPTTRTRVLEVTVDSTDPQLATDFANTLSQEFIAQNIESRWTTVQSTSEWLHRELEDARSKLRSSEDTLQHYATTSGLIFTDETNNVATEKLQQLQQNLSASTADRIAKQSRFELAQNAPPDSLGDVLNDIGLRDTLAKINDVKRQLADATTVFVPESTKVQRLQAELEALQSSFDRQKADIVTHIKNDFTEASRKEKLLTDAYDSQAREVTGQDEKAIQYNILKRDVDSNRQLYDTMLQQMKQASISSAIRAGNIRVVDPAQIPDAPVSPDFRLNSALGTFLGFFASIALIMVRERADRTLQQPGDIKLWTDITELGVIPNAALDSQAGGFYSPSAGVRGKLNLFKKAATLRLSHPVELVTAQKTTTPSAEAFRSTLTSMLFISEEANRPRVMVFTSANAADGKTTVVTNLAIAAAEIRMKVLIIDADLRRPRVHDILNIDNQQGLVDILAGDTNEVVLRDFIKATSRQNLSVLPAGPPTEAAAHLLYSPIWGALLEKLRTEYDLILIDTPPMLQMTDARVAARMADAVILVARSNITTRDALLAAKDRLYDDRIPILGAVLNAWNPNHSPGGYYGYYRSNYYKTNYAAAAKA